MELNNVNITPTMRCNLKCQLCGVLVPHYEYRPHMTLEEFQKNLDTLFTVVDSVGRLQVTGGEPLLNLQMAEMLAYCFEYGERFSELWFFSNCAVPFRQDVLEVLSRHKDQVVVHCSDYGVRPAVSDENRQLLEKYGLPYKYLKYYGEQQYCDGWVDNGDFIPHHRSKAENEAVFRACSHVNRGGSWYLRNGQLHWCGRSIRGTELGRIPLMKEDYLDLFDDTMSKDDKRQKLKELMKVSSITACDYCNGYYGTEDPEKRRPAGEQMI